MNIAKFEDLVEELKAKLNKDTNIVVVEEPAHDDTAKKVLIGVLSIVGAVTILGAIGYFLYQYLKPDYLEDYEEDFEDLDEEPEVED